MAGRPRKPIELHKLDGKSRLTKAEIEYREKTELNVDLKDITVPSCLTKKQSQEFMELAGKLLHVGIMTELDEETLARYILEKDDYHYLRKKYNRAKREDDLDEMVTVSNMLDKTFKRCRACANDLGLTISSRCRLVLPKVEEPPANKFVEKFGD
jgi:P27 family predicted phage terminase small subunit